MATNFNTPRSDNYALVCAHYKALLSEHYTWTFGDASQKHNVNQLRNEMTITAVLSKYLNMPKDSRVLDLGCGSG